MYLTNVLDNGLLSVSLVRMYAELCYMDSEIWDPGSNFRSGSRYRWSGSRWNLFHIYWGYPMQSLACSPRISQKEFLSTCTIAIHYTCFRLSDQYLEMARVRNLALLLHSFCDGISEFALSLRIEQLYPKKRKYLYLKISKSRRDIPSQLILAAKWAYSSKTLTAYKNTWTRILLKSQFAEIDLICRS